MSFRVFCGSEARRHERQPSVLRRYQTQSREANAKIRLVRPPKSWKGHRAEEERAQGMYQHAGIACLIRAPREKFKSGPSCRYRQVVRGSGCSPYLKVWDGQNGESQMLIPARPADGGIPPHDPDRLRHQAPAGGELMRWWRRLMH